MLGPEPPVPPLSEPHAAILAAFVAHHFDLAATAAAVNRSILDLLAWHRDPAVRLALDELEGLEDRAARLQWLAARRAAIAELHHLTTDPDTPPSERRRAATALVRPLNARPFRFPVPEGGGCGAGSCRPQSTVNPARDGLGALPRESATLMGEPTRAVAYPQVCAEATLATMAPPPIGPVAPSPSHPAAQPTEPADTFALLDSIAQSDAEPDQLNPETTARLDAYLRDHPDHFLQQVAQRFGQTLSLTESGPSG